MDEFIFIRLASYLYPQNFKVDCMKILTKQNMEDLLTGTQLLGCGGGGEIEWGRQMIDEVHEKGKHFKIIDPKELPDDKFVFIVGTVGGGVSEEIKKKFAAFLEKLTMAEKVYKPILVAKEELAKFLGEDAYAYIPSEIGAGNTITPMYVAALEDKPVVDGDNCGRAKPEIAISTSHVMDVSVTPLVIANPFGDVVILKVAMDDYRAEDICRATAVASGGLCGVARCPAKGRVVKNSIVPNSITKCMKIGEAIREAKETEKDPVQAFIKTAGGYKIFEGKINGWEREERGGFMWGTMIIQGTGDYKEHELKVWYKNEYLVSWIDEKPYVTCPDSICIIEKGKCYGISVWVRDLEGYLGKEVVAVGIKAADLWRTAKGIEIFSPKHFGYDIEYTPLEKLVCK